MAKGPGAVTEVNVNRHNRPNPTTMPQKAPVLVDLFQNNAPQVVIIICAVPPKATNPIVTRSPGTNRHMIYAMAEKIRIAHLPTQIS